MFIKSEFIITFYILTIEHRISQSSFILITTRLKVKSLHIDILKIIRTNFLGAATKYLGVSYRCQDYRWCGRKKKDRKFSRESRVLQSRDKPCY